MRYLATAFCGEGPTDHAFVGALVQRTVEHIVAARAEEVVEIGGLQPVLPGGEYSNQADAVAAEFLGERVFADLLFVHTDAGSGVPAAYAERVEPVREAFGQADRVPRVVGVVPHRETEAWMLADIRAFERVLGLAEMSLTAPRRPRLVHAIPDPKAVLRDLVRDVDAAPSRARSARRLASRIERLYTALAAEVSIECLLQVPSYRRFYEECEDALKELGVIV